MTQEEFIYYAERSLQQEIQSTAKDTYCRYDAHNNNYIIEFKSRRKHYDTQLIEYAKFDCNMEIANKENKEFLYMVETPEGVYTFNVSKLSNEGYDFGWEDRRMPAKTDFSGSHRKDKKVGYIAVKDAV